MEKPFKTLAEQASILESRGLIVDEAASAALAREGYYALVNGYKDPFLDSWETGMAGEDRYLKGTKLSDLLVLFNLDRELRSLFLKYAIIAEAALKTACSYCFSEAHPNEVNPYLAAGNYTSDSSAAHMVASLVGEYKKILAPDGARKTKRGYLRHYMDNHGGEVPLWVLMKYLTLGQAFKFFTLQGRSMQNSIAKYFSVLYADSHADAVRIEPDKLRLVYDHIKDFRNICAHDERFYCARVAKAEDVAVKDLCSDLRLVLTADAHSVLMYETLRLVQLASDSVSVKVDIAAYMGWRSMDELTKDCADCGNVDDA